MDVARPVHTMDFDFNSARSSPCASIPSTPKRFGEYYFSAPTSPLNHSEFYQYFDELLIIGGGRSDGNGINEGFVGDGGSCLAIPFDWEEKPGIPKSINGWGDEDDFAFHVSEEPDERLSVSADELFDGGMIKPLKPPPRLQLSATGRVDDSSLVHNQKSPSQNPPVSPGKRIFSNPFSPKQMIETSPFSAMESEKERGRGERQASSFGRKGSRSLSPFRVSQYPWEEEDREDEEQQKQQLKKTTRQNSTEAAKPLLASTSSRWHKKWRIKDFFLFRSASEGRAADKDPLRKYTAAVGRKQEELDVKKSSLMGTKSRRRGKTASAHELHYTANRAASEDLKKKTFLPYRPGILGRLSFNPAVHVLVNGFGLSRK